VRHERLLADTCVNKGLVFAKTPGGDIKKGWLFSKASSFAEGDRLLRRVPAAGAKSRRNRGSFCSFFHFVRRTKLLWDNVRSVSAIGCQGDGLFAGGRVRGSGNEPRAIFSGVGAQR
jgi:hypothetical protein